MGPELSFFMALAALLLTLATIIVTIMNFRKSAGRVTVKMNAALYDPARSLLVNEKGKWGVNVEGYERTGIELAKIVIENPGRTGATITSVSFRIEGSYDPDLTMSVVPLAARHSGNTTPAVDIPHRLEPYDQVVYLMDFWPVVRHTFATEPNLRQINIRASVKVAGQPHTYESTNHGYWTIRREWASVVAPYQQQTVQNVILGELMNVFTDPGQNPYLKDLSAEVERRIRPDSTSFDITSALQNAMGPGGKYRNNILGEYNVMAMIRFGSDVKRIFDAVGKNLIWAEPVTPASDEPQPQPEESS